MNEKPTYLFRRTLRGFEPVNGQSEEVWRKVKLGAVVALDFRRPRNIQHHRKWWALCSLVAENLDDVTPEVVCEVIKHRTGHVTVVHTAKGEVLIPKSISFAAMDQTEFEAFYERALKVISEEVIPGIGLGELEREVMEFMK